MKYTVRPATRPKSRHVGAWSLPSFGCRVREKYFGRLRAHARGGSRVSTTSYLGKAQFSSILSAHLVFRLGRDVQGGDEVIWGTHGKNNVVEKQTVLIIEKQTVLPSGLLLRNLI